MKVVQKEAKNKEEALFNALADLNAGPEEVIFNSEEEESSLFKGIKYTVNAVTKYEVKEFIKNYLNMLAHYMNTKFMVEINEFEEGFNVLITTDNNAILIGKGGKNLNSIQILLRETIKNATNLDIKINLDVAGYKEKQAQKLASEIKKIAREVLDTKIDAKLDSMNSYDRRIVHNVISKYDNLVTESKGETPDRYVVIKYKKD